MQSNAGASTSSTPNAGPSSGRQARRRRVMSTSEDNSTLEEADQLISSDSDDIPIARTISNSLSRGTQATPGPSSSSGVAGPSSSSCRSGLPHVSVSSPSLPKILHSTNIESFQKSSPSLETIASSSCPAAHDSVAHVPSHPSPAPEPLADYTCPICFFPPTNATLTPCGHICCGSCLFMAVKSTLQRGTLVNDADANVARCPVCRAPIPGWDGRGGGVIGLKARTLLTL
ncbi:E3 ubiquitin-protein ligase complex slx8-rfp subunit slx8 [Termitomyces sp. J132]|nr:E3 ubiquitin-protein ligase complex slx8-rfp subunit slx8 [Termitomyces sp. J132]